MNPRRAGNRKRYTIVATCRQFDTCARLFPRLHRGLTIVDLLSATKGKIRGRGVSLRDQDDWVDLPPPPPPPLYTGSTLLNARIRGLACNPKDAQSSPAVMNALQLRHIAFSSSRYFPRRSLISRRDLFLDENRVRNLPKVLLPR